MQLIDLLPEESLALDLPQAVRQGRPVVSGSGRPLAAADSISEEEEPLIMWLHETWKIQ